MTSTTDPTPTLAAALTGLTAAARTAGVDPDQARAEGEALAATIAESARGAFLDWAEQVGGGRGSEEFFAAASRGRKWRSQPTSLLSGLVIGGSPHAATYAEALNGVCQAATGLGEQSVRVVGNATTAAAAQLKSVQPPDPEPEPIPAAEHEPEPERPLPAPEKLLSYLSQINTRQLRDQTERIRDLGSTFLFGRRDDAGGGQPAGPARSSNPFDLSNLPSDTPGAFAGFPGGGPAPDPTSERAEPTRPTAPPTAPTATPPTDPTAAAGAEPAPTQAATAPAAPTVVEPEPEPRSVEELLAELDALIGLERVKREIHRQVAVLKVERLRIKAGLKSPTITRHLIFTGNPGTGKTTVARLVAGIYRALGLLSKGQLVEVDRSELVAGYLGQTAIKTTEVVASATGGVLFIDEAYSLSAADDQYGQEAVDTLVKEMEDKRDDLVVIVAGYPAPMAEFIDHNPGLSSRFRTEIGFEDYTDDELVAIFRLLAGSSDYDVTDDCEQRFRMILAITPRGSTFGNGRFARNCLEAAIGRHAWRLRDLEEPTLEQLRELRAEDLDEHDGDDEPSGNTETGPDDAADPGTTNPLDVTGPPSDPDDVIAPDPSEPSSHDPEPVEAEVVDTVVPAPADEQLTPEASADEQPGSEASADEQPGSEAPADYPWWASEPDATPDDEHRSPDRHPGGNP